MPDSFIGPGEIITRYSAAVCGLTVMVRVKMKWISYSSPITTHLMEE
jgi:hypothetical protein